MDAPLTEQIHYHIASYLRGETSVDDLRLWLMPLFVTLDRENEPAAFQMVSKTALFIAEFGAGHRTETELRGLIGPLVRQSALIGPSGSPTPE